MRNFLRVALLAALAGFAIPSAALADHPGQPPLDPAILKDLYRPIGFYKPGDPVPAPNGYYDRVSKAGQVNGRRFNPSGNYNAFDNNVFETLALPFRAAGDTTTDDPFGNAPKGRIEDPRHGFCSQPPDPAARPGNPLLLAGVCPNHQLEYGMYYEETMRDILGDFGMTFRRYRFQNQEQSAPVQENTLAGSAINPAAVVPGADHPEDTVIVGAHYDQTNDGPASAWDSAEGHAQIIRVAKIMADYWRTTGTRPSATVKFIPWDGEESGTLGSLDYAQNNIVPGEEHKVRAYFNTDPCAGGYPAFRSNTLPRERIDLGIQLADPAQLDPAIDKERIKAFNAKAPNDLEAAFEYLDDKLNSATGAPEIFVSKGEGGANADIGRDVILSGNRPLLFSSDWANFLAKGIPFFNPGPEITGPDNTLRDPGNPDGIAILHTPNDNIPTINRLTGNADGNQFSEGWIKGMEMCAHLLANGMLQPEQGGTQGANGDVVAYYEALPNEAIQNQKVRFDAGGSHMIVQANPRQVSDADLEYTWDFGDGTRATGQVVEHSYAEARPEPYPSVLTVRNTRTGATDTMRVPITVIGSNFDGPDLAPLPAEDADGTFDLSYKYSGKREGAKLDRFRIEESRDFRTLFGDDAEGDLRALWTPNAPNDPKNTRDDDIEPWQKHPGPARKFRDADPNQEFRGKASYWTGIQPQNFSPASNEIQSGQSILTLNQPLAVPAEGSPQLSYFSLFQNEGDDRGRVEVAIDDGDPATEPEFETVDDIFATSTALGGPFDRAVCNPAEPDMFTEPLRFRLADLSNYRGKSIVVRFVMSYGPENRALSQPCGWYIDDIKVQTGTFKLIGETPELKFPVTGRPPGTLFYSVKALFDDGVTTESSNVETTRVTVGVPETAGPGGDRRGEEDRRRAEEEERRACLARIGFGAIRARETRRRGGVFFNFTRRTAQPVTVDIFQQSRGRRIFAERRVRRFTNRTKAFAWNGRDARGRRVPNGFYSARFSTRAPDGRIDAVSVTLGRSKGRFGPRRAFVQRATCGSVAAFKLSRPVFGGKKKRSLGIAYRLNQPATAQVVVANRRERVVRRFPARQVPAGSTQRLSLAARGLRRGEYRIKLLVTRGGATTTTTLVSTRL